MKFLKPILILIFLVAAAVRLADAFRPINQPSWRECDLGSISRNYVLEGMNIFYPRIDWRGQTEGFAEMEFPLYPWLIAVTYKVFGIHDFIGRIWSFLFSLGTLFFFLKLARKYLDETGQIFAFLFFAFNPMLVEFSTAIQPEGLMILAYVASVYFFTSWLEKEDTKYFWLAAAATALTILAKASSAHIGLFFGVLLIQKYGTGVLRKGKVWLFAVLTLAPAAVWYVHAKGLWKTYGNSLGVSNEYHWIGWDFFTNPYFVKGIAFTEFFHVWLIFGLVVGLFGICRGVRENAAKNMVLWFASIFVMYAIASRTTADSWAYYYHIFSIPPAALIFGFGVEKLRAYALNSAVVKNKRFLQRSGRPVIILLVSGMIFLTLSFELWRVYRLEASHHQIAETYACAMEIKPTLERKGSILVSGGSCFDPDGYPVAYNASYVFYWLERKGANICVEDQNLDKVRSFAESGTQYFIAEKPFNSQRHEFEDQLRATYPIAAECGAFVVFDIASPNSP